jgi:hypothetical protein
MPRRQRADAWLARQRALASGNQRTTATITTIPSRTWFSRRHPHRRCAHRCRCCARGRPGSSRPVGRCLDGLRVSRLAFAGVVPRCSRGSQSGCLVAWRRCCRGDAEPLSGRVDWFYDAPIASSHRNEASERRSRDCNRLRHGSPPWSPESPKELIRLRRSSGNGQQGQRRLDH